MLLCAAFVYIAIGYSWIDPTDEARRTQSAIWRDSILPAWAWGTAWVAVGIACGVAAFFRRFDDKGFAPAVAMAAAWGAVEFTGWLFGEVDQGYRPTLIWLGWATFIWFASRLKEPTKPPLPPKEGPHS